ncbi:MAG: dienelactone hydrolase family protein [Candidatus Kapaibacteriota bacterium]
MNRYAAFFLPFALVAGVDMHQATSDTPKAKAPAAKATAMKATATTNQASCCSLEETKTSSNQATAQFAALSTDRAFVNKHEEPLAASFQTKGTAVKVKAADGTECFGYEIKPGKESKNVIFVIHEWWGLNDYIKQEADKLSAELGARVIALDLYDGKVATTREDAGKYMQSNKAERSKAIISAFQQYVGTDAKIATIGWCFGGGWSHQASLALGKQAVGCVIYYGMPETDATKLATMNAPTLGIFAKQDKWITPEVASKFEAATKAAGKSVEIKLYDADHAFANPSNPKFAKDLAEDAHKAVLAFFKKCFA